MEFNVVNSTYLAVGFFVLAFVVDEVLKKLSRGSSGKGGDMTGTRDTRFGKRKILITTTVVIED